MLVQVVPSASASMIFQQSSERAEAKSSLQGRLSMAEQSRRRTMMVAEAEPKLLAAVTVTVS